MSSFCENCECNSETEVCADCDWRTKRYKIPKFATNGDVIKALFPDAKIYIDVFNNVHMNFDNDMPETVYYNDWWNALYKAESEDTL